MDVKAVLGMVAKLIYFLLVVASSMVLAFTANGQIIGKYAALAGIVSAVVLALALFLLLAFRISWRKQGDSLKKQATERKKEDAFSDHSSEIILALIESPEKGGPIDMRWRQKDRHDFVGLNFRSERELLDYLEKHISEILGGTTGKGKVKIILSLKEEK